MPDKFCLSLRRTVGDASSLMDNIINLLCEMKVKAKMILPGL